MSAIPKESLTSYIEKAGIEASNADSPERITDLLFGSGVERPIKSLDDEQLLVKVPFSSPVKIAAIKLKCSPQAVATGTAPKVIKLFTNDFNMDFSLASETQPKQTITIESETQKESLKSKNGLEISLRYVNFQNVRHLTLFIESNQGGVEVSELGLVEFYGSTESNLDMHNWKKGDSGNNE